MLSELCEKFGVKILFSNLAKSLELGCFSHCEDGEWEKILLLLIESVLGYLKEVGGGGGEGNFQFPL